MFTTRTFSANIGDESVLNAGPDAIETDIDHLLANDAEINAAKINKVDIVNDAVTGGSAKVLSAEAGKVINERIDTIVYSSVVNDLTTGGVDVALSAEQGIVLNESRTSSYLAFCGNVNATMLDAAFGKNNEDKIISIGRQLAMYAWFKGDSKVTYPFTNLLNCNTFQECLDNAWVEICDNANITSLINASPYASQKICEMDNLLKSICSDQTLSNTFATILQSNRATIIETLNNSSLFSKQSNIQYSGTSGTALQSSLLDTNTILIPTSSPALVTSAGGNYGTRDLYYGANSSNHIWGSDFVDNKAVITITSGVSLRGIYYKQSVTAEVTTMKVICDVYTVI